MALRYHQARDIERCGNALADTPSIVYQLPTGGGKTHMFSEIANRFITRNSTSVVIVVHRTELLNNTRSRLFDEHDIVACEIKAGMKEIPSARVYVCMVESLNRRITKLKNIGLLILDECHIAVHNKIIDKLECPLRIGFTASPLSSNKKEPLNKRFMDIVIGPQIQELISQKFLCQNITYAPRTGVDRNNLMVVGDDFDEVEMGKEFSKAHNVINTVNAYRRWCLGTKTMVFNVNVAHSKTVLLAFLDAGFNARHLDATAKPEERTEILRWFKKTPDAILLSIGILTTGFDEPTVESIIVNRATMSMPLWLQMCGRGSRTIDAELAKKLNTYEKYLFTIIDMGQNAITHGDWCDDRNWELVFRHPPKKSKNGVAPSKMCPECEAILPTSALSCKYCTFIFPPRIPPTEEIMNNYVIMTRGINVEALISEHEEKKQYHVFYKIIRNHVKAFRETKPRPVINNEIFEFVRDACFKDCRKWCHLHSKRFNKWHQNLCTLELQKELRYEYRILQEDNQS